MMHGCPKVFKIQIKNIYLKSSQYLFTIQEKYPVPRPSLYIHSVHTYKVYIHSFPTFSGGTLLLSAGIDSSKLYFSTH